MKFKVTAITMHDGEVSELAALGVNIKVKGDSQTNYTYEADLTDEQVEQVRKHTAVVSVVPA